MQILLFFQGKNSIAELKRLSPKGRLALVGSIISGGIVAPLLLVYGIKFGTASEVSLLLNFETVATTLIAWLVFKEHVGPALWGSKALILFGAAIVVVKTEGALDFSSAGLLVVLACVFWGIDNNLTRNIEELSAPVLASIKGFGAGIFNTLMALIFSTGTATVSQVTGSLLIGAMSYGMSLVLFVEALRRIGSARTGTLFAIGPFAGTVLSVIILGERPPMAYWYAAALMLAGIGLLYREMHGHVHVHEPLSHRHLHMHDEHHLHEHDEGNGAEPHEHLHRHAPVTHAHAHRPDLHHRHGH